MAWQDELQAAAAAAASPAAAGEAEVKIGGRTIKVPAPISVGELLELVPEGEAFVAVSLEDGSKLSPEDIVEPGARIALVPGRTDG